MKREFRMAAALAMILSSAGSAIAAPRPAVSRADAQATAKQAVDGVLSGEQLGSINNRARRLRSVLRTSPQFAPAQWQSGHVNLDGKWVPVGKTVPRLAGDKTLQEYHELRAKTPKTLTGQLELATWCRQHKLYDQQRAHLTAVLAVNPNHLAARKALGFVRMGPFWISKTELKRRHEEAKQAAKDLKRWAPTVKSIRNALTRNSRERYNQAIKRLKAIDDPAAIPAVELGLAYDDPQLAMVAIDYLGGKSSRDSTLALARQGMLSPWKSLRKRAAEKLKNRRYEDFVPQVLGMTSTPLRSRQMLYVDRRGSLFYRHVFGRETPQFKSLGVAGFDQRFLLVFLGVIENSGNQSAVFNAMRNVRIADSRDQALLRARELAYQRQLEIEDRNHLISQWNGRSSRLLAVVTGKKLGDHPKAWWRWWDSYTEGTKYSQSETKPEVRIETYQSTCEAFPYYRYMSCLVAGTPVWTGRGPVAVDKVQIGDRVLSQNVETGELAYKPVLKTTVRPKRPLIALEIGPRTVRMTGGHPFWVSGKGWVKARDIKDGMAMHDITGTTPVRPAGTAKPKPTYNLIVADFHTYFVGETKVLSHDNTPIEPTNALVPGLVRNPSAGGR